MGANGNKADYVPTLEEIVKGCEAARAKWSDEEREMRSTAKFFPIGNRELQKAGFRGGDE